MTTIVSRLYASKAKAQAVADALRAEGFPASIVDVIEAGAGDTAAAIRAARVPAASAATYAAQMSAGGKALVVCRAPFNPIGAARRAMQIVDSHDPLRSGIADEDAYVAEEIRTDYMLSVLTDHPRFFSMDIIPGSDLVRGPISNAFGIPLLSRRKRDSAMRGGGFMSTKFLPFPLLTRGRRTTSAIAGGALITQGLMPTVARRS